MHTTLIEGPIARAWHGADTVYFHLYDVTDLDHVRLLGREVLPQVTNI